MLSFMHADEGSMHGPHEPRAKDEDAEPRQPYEAGHHEGRGPLSGLIGAGPSRVGISGAMRARDVARPRPEDLAAAERDIEVKHARPVNTPLTRKARPARPVPRPPLRRPAVDPDQEAGGAGSSPDRS
jgi:hypothetical protein